MKRERDRPFFRGNIESKINHPGSKRWRSWFTSNRSSSRGKKWASSINYCASRPENHLHSPRLRFYDSRSIFSRNNARVVRFIYPWNPARKLSPLHYEFLIVFLFDILDITQFCLLNNSRDKYEKSRDSFRKYMLYGNNVHASKLNFIFISRGVATGNFILLQVILSW